MITIQSFTFNPFQENTYVLHDESAECIIIDPGCYDDRERKELADYIEKEKLKPVKLINTHCHLDHVFGNGFVAGKYGLQLEMNEKDLRVLEAYPATLALYGLNGEPSPAPGKFLNEGDKIEFGKSS